MGEGLRYVGTEGTGSAEFVTDVVSFVANAVEVMTEDDVKGDDADTTGAFCCVLEVALPRLFMLLLLQLGPAVLR